MISALISFLFFKQPKQRPAEEYWFTPEGERKILLGMILLFSLSGCQTKEARELDHKIITVSGKKYYIRCGIGSSCHMMEIRDE